MIAQLLALVVLSASVSAGGTASSYSSGKINGGLGGTGIGLGGIRGLGEIDHGHTNVVDYNAPAQYQFKYEVEDAHTGDKKQQSEVRVGDVVKGEYSLAEPDGTIRVVKYTADAHNGFIAVVSRIGNAAHPQIVHKAVDSHGSIGLGDGIGLGLGGIEIGKGGGLVGHRY